MALLQKETYNLRYPMHLRVSIAMVTHSYLSEIRCIHICEHCVSLELILMCELSHVSALVLIYV